MWPVPVPRCCKLGARLTWLWAVGCKITKNTPTGPGHSYTMGCHFSQAKSRAGPVQPDALLAANSAASCCCQISRHF